MADNRRKAEPGEIFFKRIKIDRTAPGPNQELLHIIGINRLLYEQSGVPTNALFAFDALWKLGGAALGDDMISLPFWIVRVGAGWAEYRRAAMRGTAESLETSMGFEVKGGRGKAIARFETERRDHVISLDVAVLELDGEGRTSACRRVAERYNLGFDAVKKIHRKHGDVARERASFWLSRGELSSPQIP